MPTGKIRKIVVGVVLGLMVAVFAGTAHADTLTYSNGAPVFGGVNITQVRAADNFTLSSAATISSVDFYSSVFSGTFPANFSGSISYGIYNNSGGALGSLIASGSVSGLTGSLFSGSIYLVNFNLNSNVALAAGTYWLELHEGTTLSTNDGSAITWAGFGASGDATYTTNLANLPGGTNPNFELAFNLYSPDVTQPPTSAPEPTTLTMLGLGLFGMATLRRKTRTA